MVLLPMNRLHDELKKVDQYRKKKSQSFIFVQQDVEWFDLAVKNTGLALIAEEARAKKIKYIQVDDSNLKTIEVDPRGTNGLKMKESGYSVKEIFFTDLQDGDWFTQQANKFGLAILAEVIKNKQNLN